MDFVLSRCHNPAIALTCLGGDHTLAWRAPWWLEFEACHGKSASGSSSACGTNWEICDKAEILVGRNKCCNE
jgi:hypothetical protein